MLSSYLYDLQSDENSLIMFVNRRSIFSLVSASDVVDNTSLIEIFSNSFELVDIEFESKFEVVVEARVDCSAFIPVNYYCRILLVAV